MLNCFDPKTHKIFLSEVALWMVLPHPAALLCFQCSGDL